MRSPHRLALLVVLSSLAALGSLWLAERAARASPWPEAQPHASRAPTGSSNWTEDAVLDGEVDAEDLIGGARLGGARSGGARRRSGASAWVSLLGYTKQSLGQQEVGGAVVVGIPLDRIGGSGNGSGNKVVAASPSRPLELAHTEERATSPPAEEIRLSLAPLTARTAVAAAWRAAGLGVDDERLDAILTRARWSALLPEARLRATRYDDERFTTDASVDTSKLRDSTAANVGLEARLTWRLDRLVYADDEPAFERMRLERHDARGRIAGRVLDALFHWQRAELELRWAQAAARDAREAVRTRDELDALLRLMEAEATLDVLTGGWFGVWRAGASAVRKGR